MLRYFLPTISILAISLTLFAGEENFGLKISGFIKADHMLDSRQVTVAREGHFLFYPKPPLLDSRGADINSTANFNQLAVQTRIRGSVTAPDAFGAKMSGVIEGAFFGQTNTDINGLRLRHAFVKFGWTNTVLLFGQTWHPMFVTAVFPGTVSFNTGVPFQPFSRNPQARLEQNIGARGKMILAVLSQRDFTSPGGSEALRNAVIPNLHYQLQFTPGPHVFGAGIDYKVLRPALSEDGIKTDETVRGTSFIAYSKVKLGKVFLKLEGIAGENLYDMLMLGGYATRTGSGAGNTPTAYASIDNLSFWGEIYGGKKFSPGIFFGYTENRGAGTEVNLPVESLSRGCTIKDVWRVSPRMIFNSGNARFASELEITRAGYSETCDAQGRPSGKIENVTNVRLLFAAYLFF